MVRMNKFALLRAGIIALRCHLMNKNCSSNSAKIIKLKIDRPYQP